jgi:hypothetical protein
LALHIDVVPLVDDVRADVRLVLVIGEDQVDLHIGMILGEVGDCQLGGGDRTGAGGIGIKAGHVGQHADFDVNLLGGGGATGQHDGKGRQTHRSFH